MDFVHDPICAGFRNFVWSANAAGWQVRGDNEVAALWGYESLCVTGWHFRARVGTEVCLLCVSCLSRDAEARESLRVLLRRQRRPSRLSALLNFSLLLIVSFSSCVFVSENIWPEQSDSIGGLGACPQAPQAPTHTRRVPAALGMPAALGGKPPNPPGLDDKQRQNQQITNSE